MANVFFPVVDWTDWVLPLGEAKIKAGHLLASSINFLFVCFAIFLFARLVVRAARK